LANHHQTHIDDHDESDDGAGDLDPERRKPDSRIGKMYVDMYLGRGKNNPPVTLRLSRLEDDVEEVKGRSARQERLAWSILVGLIMVLAAVIFKH
jgi:hypothetical protein